MPTELPVTRITACKVCGHPSRYLCTNLEVDLRIPIHTFVCSACGLTFVGIDQISSLELARAYEVLDTQAYYEETRTETEQKFAIAAGALLQIANFDSAIIDVGCGLGDFPRFLSKRGFLDLSAHEIPGSNLQAIQDLGIATYQDFNYSSIPSRSFDVVTLLDVAEHVLDPWQLFKECARIVRPGGYVYFHTPVVTILDRTFRRIPRMGRVWQRARTSIFHLQNYTAEAIVKLLSETGFVGISVRKNNELSWPVDRYVRVYLCEKNGLPLALAPLVGTFVRPLVTSELLNANKAIVIAQRN